MIYIYNKILGIRLAGYPEKKKFDPYQILSSICSGLIELCQ